MSDQIPRTRIAVGVGDAERQRAFIRRDAFINGRISGVRPCIYWKMSCKDWRDARALKQAG